MKKVLFEDIFDYLPKSKRQAGTGLAKGIYPFYTSSDDLSKYIDEFDYSGNCLIFGTGGNPSVHYQSGKFSNSTDCITACPKNTSEINVKYCYLFFRSDMNILADGFKGAGLKHISKGFISNIKIPLPPLDDQIRIADILTRAENLIAKRKESIKALDELLKSTFLEMFGDPVRNEKGWEVKSLSSFINKKRDISYGIVQRGNHVDDGIPVVRIKDIVENTFIISNLVKTSVENSNKYIRTILQGGEILLSIRGTIGEVAIAPKHSKGWNISREVAIIPIEGNINLYYLINLLKTTQIQIEFKKLVKGVAQSGMNLSDIRLIDIIYPSPILQNQFAAIVEKVESLKAKYQQNLDELEKLYGSLSQQVFSGEMGGKLYPTSPTEFVE